MKFVVKTAVVLVWLAVITGTWAQNGPNQPVVQENPTAAGDPNRPLAVNTAVYEIGSQDLIYIDVWQHEEFTKAHRVRPDGKITIPLVGEVQASGLTPERLGVQIKQALAEYVNEPEVAVSVLDVVSKSYKMAGAIAKPGTYPMPVPIRIFDAINAAGGFATEFANKKEIVIIRENSSDRPTFNYDDYVKRGRNPEKNVYLQNGDTVYVKE